MAGCLLCGAPLIELLDMGAQPVCNRYLSRPTDSEFTHRWLWGQCPQCGLLQMIDPVPAAELRPQLEWVTYREPESHLNQVADLITGLPGIHTTSTVLGVSFKEDSLLDRLRGRGFSQVGRLDDEDLWIAGKGAGVETVQDALRPEVVERVRARYGSADVILARHILEHAHDLAAFAAALKSLLSPGGYLILEIPDCQYMLEHFDYTMFWEEHTCYFTRATFLEALGCLGLDVLDFRMYDLPPERPMLAVTKPAPCRRPAIPEREEFERAKIYAAGLEGKTRALQTCFEPFRGRIAVFGAGHLSCTFINLHDLSAQIRCCVDDNPHKVGRYMPGSRLPIVAAGALDNQPIDWCLLGLSPESEDNVVANQRAFLERGGRISSILAGSPRSLQEELA